MPISSKLTKDVITVIEDVMIVWEQKTIKMVLMILFSFFKDVFKITIQAIPINKAIVGTVTMNNMILPEVDGFSNVLEQLVVLFSKVFIFWRENSVCADGYNYF